MLVCHPTSPACRRAAAAARRRRQRAPCPPPAALPTVFIDGEAGTTGLQVRERLAGRKDLVVVSLEGRLRKDPAARAAALNGCDVAVLCLPDEAAVEAVSLLEPGNGATAVVDASTAHRTAPGWAYGFPELCAGQRDRVAASKRVSNPGCYATGFLALVRPLVDAGLLPPSAALTCHAVSGYSGGGKARHTPQQLSFCLLGFPLQESQPAPPRRRRSSASSTRARASRSARTA